MDTSKEYIKMCEMAEEIQKAWKPKEWDLYQRTPDESWEEPYIWGVLPEDIADGGVYGRVFVDDEGKVTFDTDEKIIWLPRQDQLQKMVGKDIDILLTDFYDFCGSDYRGTGATFFVETVNRFSTMEQLWLAFVMREKYGKIWSTKKEEWELLDK